MTPAAEIVLLGQKARALQDTLAKANASQAELIQAEALCVEMHKALCSIMVWIAKEEKKHER